MIIIITFLMSHKFDVIESASCARVSVDPPSTASSDGRRETGNGGRLRPHELVLPKMTVRVVRNHLILSCVRVWVGHSYL